jgi:hypothetical protein
MGYIGTLPLYFGLRRRPVHLARGQGAGIPLAGTLQLAGRAYRVDEYTGGAALVPIAQNDPAINTVSPKGLSGGGEPTLQKLCSAVKGRADLTGGWVDRG